VPTSAEADASNQLGALRSNTTAQATLSAHDAPVTGVAEPAGGVTSDLLRFRGQVGIQSGQTQAGPGFVPGQDLHPSYLNSDPFDGST
jgi:hypothetical protein